MILNDKMRLSLKKDCWSDETSLLQNCLIGRIYRNQIELMSKQFVTMRRLRLKNLKCKTLHIYLI